MRPMLLNKKILFVEDQAGITDKFVQEFAPDEACSGAVAKVIVRGVLPVGVNPNDHRVQDVIRRCQLSLFRKPREKEAWVP